MRLACLLSASVAILCASTLAAAPTTPRDASGLSIDIAGGRVNGMIDPSLPCVRQFLGIPYGQPPLGELRFAPPKPALPFGDINATQFPPSCMQYLMEWPESIYTQDIFEFNLQGLNSTSPNISEDCLTLSIWTPTDKTRAALLPVILFITGGAFAVGGEDIPYQNPAQWVQRTQVHIVVTFNYRMNIFGFPNAAGIPVEHQNPGLLDQRLAVEWIRDNIAAFGGDPQRITLWGQSAGAVSAGYYQFAYPQDPVVSGIIMDSGSEQLTGPVFLDPEHTNFTYVAQHFGCGGLAPKAELECMRGGNISAHEVEDFIQSHDQSGVGKFLFFIPAVDNITMFSDYTARAEAGQIAKIPSIVGSNDGDGIPFVPLGPDGVNQTDAFALTLVVFFCTGYKAATNRIMAGAPVFRYEYSANISSIAPKPWMGAYHSSELPMIFGTYANYRQNLTTNTGFEVATSNAMQDAWLAFASNGASGMPGQDWPQYTDSLMSGQVRAFGLNGVPAQNVDKKAMEALCPPIFQPSITNK
ncbi:alpha/beta-hydrolase [Podospora appendiculata]|uniref:Carboxylic ester hydrolase n=1 Tax=Podospora appendiculata TaxID=314037 RepID=A0AAE0X875_9PEZI|nr:alpha/beta-hydrolase [Podospora appendiculata]